MTGNCVADTLKDLAACFKQEAMQQKGQIIIDPSFLTADVQAVLGRSDIVVTGVNPAAIPDDPQQSLTICGTTPQDSTDSFLSLLGMPVCLTFLINNSSPSPRIVLQMRVTLSNTWAFGTSFPELAGQAADLLSFAAAYLYVSTVPVPLTMDVTACVDATNPPDVAIAPGVSFWGTAGLTGPFAPIVSLLDSVTSSLELYGSITRPAQQPGPSINLALVNTLSFTIPGQIITITAPTAGMEVVYISDPDDKSVVSPVTVPYVKASVGVDTYTLDIQADLWEDTSTIDFVVAPDTPTSTDFQSMGALVGSDNVTSLQGLVSSETQVQQLLTAIQFKRCWASVTLGDTSSSVADRADVTVTLSTPTLASVGILVGTPGYDFDSDQPLPPAPLQDVWTPFDGVSLAFNFYGAVFSPASSEPLFLGELEATAWVKKQDASYYIFTVDVTVPDFMISGYFVGTIDLNLATIVSDLFGNEIELPNHLADFQLSDLTFSADVTGKNYTFSTMINGELFGSDVLQLIDTSTRFTVDASGSTPAVTGAIDGIISLGGVEFQVDAVISNAPTVDTVFKLHMVDETVGSLLNQLVHLVDPGLDISLPAPWDRFLAISLDALELDINVTKGSVSVSYNADIDLVFVQIDTLTLTYQQDPVQSTVEIEISGSFLGQSYGKDGADPLSFDPINGSPPAVPQGSLLDLRYLGMGQHVTVQGLQTKTTMTDIIAAMEQAMKSTTPDFTQGMIFSDQSAWLIGTDFTLLSFLRLAVIFNDPNVYGLLVQLSGDKAGSFAGLSFEILYRKISDSIGLYHIDLTLPDEFRHLEFGEVSVTLPVVIVDIYTNGNFLIDLGFPYNMDFSQSFSVQVFPFVGYGGVYFGVLSGATSSRVPQITNGTWDPVVVFGFGLSLGVGKTIDEGVFSAGLSVTLEGVLEGVIGWFNPSSSAVPSDHYYWLQGTAEIVGQLYGTIDFKIIKASVNVTAYASVTLIVEAYEPIYLSLTAGVSVSVSVKVVFFTIHFSFKATISASWSIGSKSTPPWQVAAGSQQASAAVLFRPTLSAGQRQLPARILGERIRALRAAADEAPLQWTPVPQFYTSPQPLNVVIGPVFTVTGGVPQCVPLLFLENSIDPNAVTPAEIQNVDDAAQAANQPFNLLAQAMLQWAIEAWQRTVTTADGTINLGNLQYILEQLGLPDAEDSAFPYTNLAQFLGNNFNLQLSLRPVPADDDSSATVFPMIPELSMTAGGTTIYFNDQSAAQVDAGYADKLAAYFAALSAEFMQGVAADGSTDDATSSQAAGTESLATAVFRNYFFMITKAAVRSALDLLTAYPCTPGSQSLQQIYQAFPAVNGQEVTAESIVHANQSTQGILIQQDIALSGVSYQTRSGDTLSSWLKPFGLTPLGMLTAEIAPDVSANAYRPGLLQPGATLTINSASAPPSTPLTLTSQPGDTFGLIASLLLVRSAGSSIYPQFSGLADLAQGIALANKLQSSNPSQMLSPGTALTVPNGSPPWPTYTVRPGDSLYAVAASFLNVQQKVVPIDGFVNALIKSYPTIDPNNVPANTILTLPEIDHVVLAGETVASIAATFLMPSAPSTTDITTLYDASTLATLPLQPLAVIPLPNFQYGVQSNDTLGSIAEQFNLTLAGLAQALFTQSPLFSDSISIVVPNVPAIEIQELLDTMLTAGKLNTVSSMVSRFLLHGMQIPLPSDSITAAQLEADPSVAAKVAVAPLYQLLGQQVATPSAPPTLTFANAGNVSWITFVEGAYPIQTQGETLTSILAAFVSPAQQPDFTTWLGTLNPGVNLQALDPPTDLTFPVAAPLPATYTVQNPDGETAQSISEALAPGQPATLRTQMKSLSSNSGINFTQRLPNGTVVTLPPSFPNLQLELILATEEQNLSSGLQNIQIDGNSGLQLYRLPLYHNTPDRYTLQKHVAWQAAQLPAYLGPANARASGTPSVWLFPNGLIQALEQPPDSYLRYGLYTGVQQTANQPMTISPVQTYAWGTLINVELQRIPETVQTQGASNAYLLAGADEVGQELLYTILPFVDQNTSVSLLYQPNPGSQNATGYASDALDPSATFILQTNLSQLSNSPSVNAAALAWGPADAAAAPSYAAAIADAPNFLRLLWECGVIRSGGYYLNYVTGDGKAALPASVFSGGDSAILGLLVVLNGNSAATPTQDPPAAYLNCAVVADNIDGGSANVFVQALVATVQTTDGVNDTLESITSDYNTTYVKSSSPSIDVPGLVMANQNVRGLLRVGAAVLLAASPGPTYTVQEGDTFASIAETKEIDLGTLATLNGAADILQPGALVQFASGQLDQGAAVQPGNTGFAMQRPAPIVGGPPIPPQAYADQMFQLLEFQINANSYFNVSGPGLPAGPGDPNPYGDDTLLSVPGDSTAFWSYRQAFSVTRFAVGVQDVLPITVGVNLALPPRNGGPYAGIVPGAELQLGLSFRDILGNTGSVNPPLALSAIPVGYFDDLISFAQWPGISASYLFTGTPAQLDITLVFQPDRFMPGGSDSPTGAIRSAGSAAARFAQVFCQLRQDDLSIRYRTTMDASSLADAGQGATDPYLLDKSDVLALVAHAYLFTAAMGALEAYTYPPTDTDSVQSVCEAFAISPGQLFTANQSAAQNALFSASLNVPVQYATRPQDSLNSIVTAAGTMGYTVTPESLADSNDLLPLQTGTVLITPQARTYTTTGTEALQNVTKTMNCSIAGIVNANTIQGVLQEGFTFRMTNQNGQVDTYPVGLNDTFDTVAEAFATTYHITASAVDVATNNQQYPGMFTPQKSLSIPDLVVGEQQSFSSIHKIFTIDIDALAERNNAVPNIFPPGTVVQLLTTTAQNAEETLAEIAVQYQCSLDTLAGANTPAGFASPASVLIPGCVVNPQPCAWPYRAAGTENLAELAGRFKAQPLDLLALSQDIPGIFQPNIPITVGTATVQTSADSTFAGLLAALQQQDPTVQAAQLADAVANPAILRNGALIVLPPVSAGQYQSLEALAGALNISVPDLAQANSTVQGFLQPNAPVSYTASSRVTWTYSVQPNDTLNTLLARCNAYLQAQGMATPATLADLAAANSGVTLVSEDTAVLPLPPDPVLLSMTVQQSLPGAMFPLAVELELDRPRPEANGSSVIDPDFANVTSVYQSAAALSPQGFESAGNDSPGANPSLRPFAVAFEAAFPGLKVATGQGISEVDTTRQETVWVVDFQTAGAGVTPINYQVQGDDPVFFSIPPISTTLWGDTVNVPGYISGQGLTPDQPKTFQSVDLDVWGRMFLEAVDLVLSPAYAVPANQIDPADLDTVVAAKGTLATAIAQQLTGVLKGQTDPLRLQAAVQTLEQNLLVQLAQAYSIDTVVQYPVQVSSTPYSDPVTAARLSGKVSPRAYVTGLTDDLTTLATAFQVGASYVAITIATYPGILAQGQVVGYGQDQPYTIGPSDTLSTIATHFAVSVADLANGLTLQNSELGLFAAHSTINIAGLSYRTGSKDTFVTLAEFFDTSLENVGLANEAVGGLLPAGTYTINKQTVVLHGTETLSQIAQDAGTAPDQVPVLLASTYLQSNVSVFALQTGQAFSLSTAKVELAPPATGADPTLTFLFTARSPGTSRSETLNLNYVVNAIECPLAPPNSNGYQPSTWLSFILPLSADLAQANGAIGQVEIPIPLRAYPNLPVMQDQQGMFAKVPPTNLTLQDLRQWAYSFCYCHQSAAQDETCLTVEFNQIPSMALALQDTYTLPEALARFVTVWPLIQADLALLPQIPQGSSNAHAGTGLAAFAALAGDVATAWLSWTEQAHAIGAAGGTTAWVYQYELDKLSNADGTLAEVILTLDSWPSQDQKGSQLGWPDISVAVAGQQLVPLHANPNPNEPGCTYTYPSEIRAPQTQDVTEWQFCYAPLDLMVFQNAWAGVSITRNANLLSGSGADISSLFVYSTPTIGFANKLVPFLTADDVISFGQGNETGLQAALQSLFTTLLDSQTATVGVACRYGYEIQPGDGQSEGIVPLIPILLYPPGPAAGLADTLYTAIDGWYKGKSLASTNAAYYLSLTVYSSLDADDSLPLLTASQLSYELTS